MSFLALLIVGVLTVLGVVLVEVLWSLVGDTLLAGVTSRVSKKVAIAVVGAATVAVGMTGVAVQQISSNDAQAAAPARPRASVALAGALPLDPPTTTTAPTESESTTDASAVVASSAEPAAQRATEVQGEDVCKNDYLGFAFARPTNLQMAASSTYLGSCEAFDWTTVTENDTSQQSVILGNDLVFTRLVGAPEAIVERLGDPPTRRETASVAGRETVVLQHRLVTTYLVPDGSTTLVAQLMTSEAEAKHHEARATSVRNLLESLTVRPSICRNSSEIWCGEFYFDPHPTTNLPLEIDVTISDETPLVGDEITIQFAARDGDADVIDFQWGDSAERCDRDEPVVHGVAVRNIPQLIRVIRERSKTARPAGAWDAPGPRRGDGAMTIRCRFDAPGDVIFGVSAMSSNSEAPGGHDPYLSISEQIKRTLIVRPRA